MKIIDQKPSVEVLKLLYDINEEDATFYKNASFFMKRIFFKKFFQRLSTQKQSSCSSIKIMILNQIEQEFSEFHNHCPSILNDKTSSNFHYFNFEKNRNKVIKECQKREMKALISYESALLKMQDHEIRKILVIHHKDIQNHLREMKIMGVNIFLV